MKNMVTKKTTGKLKKISYLIAFLLIVNTAAASAAIATDHNKIDKTEQKTISTCTNGGKTVGEMQYNGYGVKTYYDLIKIPIAPGHTKKMTFKASAEYIDSSAKWPDDCRLELQINPPAGKSDTHYVNDVFLENNHWQGELSITYTFKLTGLKPQYRQLRLGYDALNYKDDSSHKRITLKIVPDYDVNPNVDIVRPIEGHKYVNDEDKGPSSNGQTIIKGSLTIVAELPSKWVEKYDVWVKFIVDNRKLAKLNENHFSYQGDKYSVECTWSGEEDSSLHSIKVAAWDDYKRVSDSIRIHTSKIKSSDNQDNQASNNEHQQSQQNEKNFKFFNQDKPLFNFFQSQNKNKNLFNQVFNNFNQQKNNFFSNPIKNVFQNINTPTNNQQNTENNQSQQDKTTSEQQTEDSTPNLP